MSCPRPSPFKCSAVISDVDGTLVTNDKILTARSQAAVAKLRASGKVFSVISSRPPRGLRMVLEPLVITHPIGGFNGGVIATPDLVIIAEHLLSPQVVGARSICSTHTAHRCGFSAATTGWCATPTRPTSGWKNTRYDSDRQRSKILDNPQYGR